MPNKEVMAWASAQWKAMGDEERAPFVQAYSEEKAEYDRALEEYDNSRTHVPTMPTRPMNAYQIFLRDFREANPEMNFRDAQKTVSERWKTMPDEDKEVYQAKAVPLKEAYQEQVIEYRTWLKKGASMKASEVKTGAALRNSVSDDYDVGEDGDSDDEEYD